MSQSRTTLDRDDRVVVTGVRRSGSPLGDVRWDTDNEAGTELGRDRVRWGPILAGVLTALTTMLLLGLAGLAAGLTAVDANQAQSNTNAAATDASRNALIWSALSAIVAFFVGGYVAAKTAGTRDRTWGALNGALVFVAALPIMLWLAAQGAGAALGALGDLRDTVNTTPGANVDANQVAHDLRNGATGALVGSLLGLIASGLGGMLGAPERQPAGHDERERPRGDERARGTRGGSRAARQW